MIRIGHLTVEKRGRTICAATNLVAEASERVVLWGRNGSGKSTLLRVLAGLENAASGDCVVNCPPSERILVHQSPYLFRGAVAANVSYGLRARGVSAHETRERVARWLAVFALRGQDRQPAHTLSGGEARRVALARAMVLEPKLLLLDEPFADLDALGVSALTESLPLLSGTTVVVASPVPLSGEMPAPTRRWELSGPTDVATSGRTD